MMNNIPLEKEKLQNNEPTNRRIAYNTKDLSHKLNRAINIIILLEYHNIAKTLSVGESFNKWGMMWPSQTDIYG